MLGSGFTCEPLVTGKPRGRKGDSGALVGGRGRSQQLLTDTGSGRRVLDRAS